MSSSSLHQLALQHFVSSSLLTSGAATQFELAQPPNDAVSSLVFAPSSPTRLLVSSWDKNVYLYDTHSDSESGHGTLLQTFEHRAPVMDVCFGADDDEAFSAGMDWTVRRIDLGSGDMTLVSKHTAPVRRVVYSREHCMFGRYEFTNWPSPA